jgi:hypothetical protein
MSKTMNLSPGQIEEIRAWATANLYISEVWLFGSRAKGSAKPDSDVDLAVTIVGRDGETPSGIWAGDHKEWAQHLLDATHLTFHIKMHDQAFAPDVFAACREHGRLLYP